MSMEITLMMLPKLQTCPQAPKLQEVLRGRDCLWRGKDRVMDERMKMTRPVQVEAGCCRLRCSVRTTVSEGWDPDPAPSYGCRIRPCTGQNDWTMGGRL